MILTLRQIADMTGSRLAGDETLGIKGVSSFEDAGPGDITFACEARYLKRLRETRAGAVIVPSDHEIPDRTVPGLPLILSKTPKLHFFRILALFYPEKKSEPGVSPNATLGETVVMGDGCSIAPNVYIGNRVRMGDRVRLFPGVFIGDDAVIGHDTTIKPNVTVMERTCIGNRVLIHSGTVLGSDGFGFTPNGQGHEKIPHGGFVQIDDDVEIGAGNTIDRGTFGRTWIKKGVKTDNLVHIAHNVSIGENTLVVAQVGIGGSTCIGKSVILAGKCGIAGHLTVGDNAIVGPLAGVVSDVKPGTIVSGIPQMPHKLWLKVGKILPRLPEMRKKLFAIEKRLNMNEPRDISDIKD